MTLRVPVLFGSAETPAESAVNVLLDAVWKAQEKDAKSVKMDHWAIRYPTNTGDVGRVCHGEFRNLSRVEASSAMLTRASDIAVRYLDEPARETLPQILQFSSEDRMTKYEICQSFGELLGVSVANIEPNAQGNDPNAAVQRPYDCHLSTRALKELGIDVAASTWTGWWRREMRAFRK